jgi:hypothetical protein
MDRFVPRDDVRVLDNALTIDNAFPVIASAARQSMPRRPTVARFVPRDDIKELGIALILDVAVALDDKL